MQLLKLTIAFGLIALAACYGEHGHGHEHAEEHHHPKYHFDYGVKDPKTGDIKNQWESRDGDAVKGEYSLHEADGTQRVVKYVADHKGGFHPHVERVGHAVHPHHGESYANVHHHH